ncbi:glycosyltransferase family 2 protein [Acidianus manzaensis]|uniref:Glycosyltransferase 2-like domain-containing protein n=1 Tax=Acidianus manzaensis TaxID=282676 RepID=A0A1W6JWL7_9CREN|nr:glycosyltransferase family 2 protein [Acidianus manzaensis]ARM74639.1 hypothetical protein B6F84_00435 [Acidianus manzaensis]
MVLISVIITAHDRKDYLMQAVNSTLNQTLPRSEYEVIVVKNFEDYNKELEEKGVKTIIANNQEQGKDIVQALKIAEGEIISFLDDDDLFLPKKLEKVKKVFENKNIVYYHNAKQDFINNNIPTTIQNEKTEEKIVSTKNLTRQQVQQLIYQGALIYNSCISIRKDKLEKYNRYLDMMPLDIDIFYSTVALLSGLDIAIHKEILTLYRVHNKNVSYTRGLKFEDWLTYRRSRFERKILALNIMLKMIRDNLDLKDSNIKIVYNYLMSLLSENKLIVARLPSPYNKMNDSVKIMDIIRVIKVNFEVKSILSNLSVFAPNSIRIKLIKKWYELEKNTI